MKNWEIKAVFTKEEYQDVMNTIDWYLTEYGDDDEMIPQNIAEWIAMLCINNVDASTIFKIVKRTQATDDAVRECVQEYLDDATTQVYNTVEQNNKIEQSIKLAKPFTVDDVQMEELNRNIDKNIIALAKLFEQ